jgi:hypothetical protein
MAARKKAASESSPAILVIVRRLRFQPSFLGEAR